MSKRKDLTGLLDDVTEVPEEKQSDKDKPSHDSMPKTLATLNPSKDSGQKNIRKAMKYVDPDILKVFPLRDRTEDWDNPKMYKDLIESMKEEGDQILPAIVRPSNDKKQPYELVAGWRRYKAAMHNGIRLYVEVRDLSDQECIKIINEENNARKDRSPFEEALYARKIWKSGIYKEFQELASALNIPKNTLSDRIAASAVSDFEPLYKHLLPRTDITLNKTKKIAPYLDDADKRKQLEGFCEKQLKPESGKPNKALDQAIKFLESLDKKPVQMLKPFHETIKVQGLGVKVIRDRKGKVKIELPYFPEEAEKVLSALAKQLKDKL